ncbi:MAG: Crp/Fnr family transcriptional regulator, partial [bacterium]|nr:Crp/Fnr family transcriptional regulator [bacterium]
KDTTLCIIPKDNWLKLLENKIILKNYLEIISTKVFKIQSKVKILSQKSIREKILFYLFSESKRINKKKIPIKSKESLSLYLNVPRPSLSRELIKLKSENVIDYNRYSITLK